MRLDCSCGTGFMLTTLVGDERDKKPGKVSHEVPAAHVGRLYVCASMHSSLIFCLV